MAVLLRFVENAIEMLPDEAKHFSSLYHIALLPAMNGSALRRITIHTIHLR